MPVDAPSRAGYCHVGAPTSLSAVRRHPACGGYDASARPPSRSGYCLYGAVGLLPTPCSVAAPYFIFTTFAWPVRYTVTTKRLSYSLSAIVGYFGPPSAAMISGTVLLCPAIKTV